MANGDSGTREEHLAWCKQRALEYVDMGDLTEAWMSFTSDMNKHSETRGHPWLRTVGNKLFVEHQLNTPDAMRDHINGYN